ncbi:hypothetical protein J4E86_000710 [Alternaria arbusti]|uniref:uncharacterized protein n=1 Tax=Alternaria arbusti TaxID=232088 RepID=UPI00221E9329|nr:uncharacterized protein J4E86_000710 [Alternaria arbusti]KAI4961681.1 hypothetical protein J4E86_000710 [Alternaria arbusti]
MAPSAKTQPPGAYIYDEIVKIAEESFPDAYNALLDVDDMPWERPDYDRVGFSSHSLFLGHIVVDGLTHKVSAYMTSEGNIQLFRRSISLSRRDNERVALTSIWAHLQENVERPGLHNLKALCGFYFVAAGYADVVNAKKGWFQDLEMASRKVGLGLGVLEDEPVVSGLDGDVERNVGKALSSHDGDVEDNVGSGDETDVTVGAVMRGLGAGVDEVKVAHILQRLLIVVKTRQESWGERIEAELKRAWPNYKKHWR